MLDRKTRLVGCAAGITAFTAAEACAAGNTYSTDMFKLTTLIGVLCGLIILIYLFDFLFRLGYGYFHHHRACKIEAVLDAEGQEFSGFISILGLDGCRFQPVNKIIENRLLTLFSGKIYHDYDIKIGGTSHPVFVDGFHGFYAACYFFDNITRADLAALLALSKTKPCLVPRIGHETTRLAYRGEIARRRRKIDALKSAKKQRKTPDPMVQVLTKGQDDPAIRPG